MKPLKLIQLALAFFQFANWIAQKVNQAEWKKQGYDEAAAKYAANWQRIVGFSEEKLAEAKAMTATQQDEVLGGDL